MELASCWIFIENKQTEDYEHRHYNISGFLYLYEIFNTTNKMKFRMTLSL